MLRAADDGVAALVVGFQLARADVIRLQESVKHDVMEALLAGGRQAIEATGPAADIGLTLSGPVAVLVVRRPAGFGGPDTAATPGRLARILVSMPLMTHRTTLLIRMHGVWLWMRRLPVVHRPAHRPQEGTR